jgi:D-xylose transport system permease protein
MQRAWPERPAAQQQEREAMSVQTDDAPRLEAPPMGPIGIAIYVWRRATQGELGNIPVVLGLGVVWGYFQLANDNFLSSGNLTNLMLQIAAMGTISVGVVMVLLLGEIDLSVAYVSALAGATMAVLNVKHEWPAVPSIAAGLAVGAGIGLLQGLWVTKLKVPSFVVTLAGFLAWQGALLRVLGSTGTVNLNDDTITGLAGTFFSDEVGWALVAVVIAATAGLTFLRRRRSVAAGLTAGPLANDLVKLGIVASGTLAAVAVFNDDRGVPLGVCIFLGFIVIFDVLTRRTVFGRHVFAIGGNAEAARRAGIRVDRVRTMVFVLASTMAATGGILYASRLLAVNKSSGSGALLLNSIAAAVIGGTSLFGGRGSAWSALLGALVIGSIANGMDLLGQTSDVKFMVTGAVLLVAATIDAVSRRGRHAAGRA